VRKDTRLGYNWANTKTRDTEFASYLFAVLVTIRVHLLSLLLSTTLGVVGMMVQLYTIPLY